MNCIEQEIVEIENSTNEKEGKAQRSKLVAVPSGRVRPGDRVRSLEAKLLDIQLPMPT